MNTQCNFCKWMGGKLPQGCSGISLTPRFSGVDQRRRREWNRFSGFPRPGRSTVDLQTVETVLRAGARICTPLKRGVNESGCQISRGKLRTKRYLFAILCKSAGTAVLLLLAGGCDETPKPPPAPPPAAVTVNQPVMRDVIEWDEYQGRMDAVDMVEVRARVTGYLQSVNFKDGAEVKQGDLLFVIDPRPYQAELDRTEADLQQASTRFELASNDMVRGERLLKARAISEEEADSRSKAERTSAAGIESARAAVSMAKLNMEYTRVTAPISGRIGRKLVTEGNLVNGNLAQASLLTTIVSLDPIYCYFDADERSIIKYQQLARDGRGLDIRDGKMACELALAGETGFPHRGVLDFVDNRVDPATGTMRVRGVFDNTDRILQPGFFTRVRVPGSAKYSALLIPDLAVGTDQGQKFVYTVNATNAVEYKIVSLGPMIDGLRVVREGLVSNDWVVVNGLMSVRPGAIVNPSRAVIASSK